MHDPDIRNERTEQNGETPAAKPLLSYGAAQAAYALLALLCIATLHGDPLYIALLIIGALAIKTWLADVKSRVE